MSSTTAEIVRGAGALVPVVRDAMTRVHPSAPVAVLAPWIPPLAPLAELTDDRLSTDVGDPLDAVLTDVQAVLGGLGRLVFVLPHVPLMAAAGGTAASAVANGVLSMARTLSIELARDAVTVNVVAVDAAAPAVEALAAQLGVLAGPGGDAVTGQEIYLTAGTDLGRLRP
ncbi:MULTISPECIES: hypothetical protein [Pseudonocardia]|uniref:Short chain dehydrogenase n=2 Tax=Pseudonocardia TaxID=1847 RepID=A0A1Y2MNY9_PSEAH|nr:MULTISPECIES: hypothetical protein [Pseudonocardia]OSY36966.1 hypothetical protein BG845_05049 [Pseudonocardia autotrophica]TDN75649.1 hypothetical protein C8E95_4827 [Pseudonocardia autotrophica]BBF99621.1 hypothetical protein Pdca_08310 [Pseudonocardia autotrophica]GEC27683.1 hypothetical protein PSA01_47120 [Pseudonocardia saturnea]